MGRVQRLKRRLVRQAVADNVDLIRGSAAERLVRRRRRGLARNLVLGGLVPIGVLASAYALTGNGAALLTASRPAAALPATTPADLPSPAPASPPPAAEAEMPMLVAPEPVAHEVFPLAVRRVVLDPGHGGASVGTRTPTGLEEKQLTLDIALRLERLLEEAGFEVVMTRSEDASVPLEERARLANASAADIFVSIHVNWIDDNGGTRGVETYYLGTTDDPYVNQLAAAENRDSGYSLADLRHLVDRIYSGVRLGKSQQLAEQVQASLYRSLRKVNPQLKDRGVKTAPFLVLVETEMPAILAEVSCLSNDREAGLLTKPLYRQFIAEALSRGIHSYAGALAPSVEKGS